MEPKYPKVLRTKEDVEFVVNNFPKEVWFEDLKEIYYLARGYYVLGVNPKYEDKEEGGQYIKVLSGYDPISEEERKKVMANDDEWDNGNVITEVVDKTLAEFDYNGKHYCSEYRVLDDSLVGREKIDIDWLEDLLFDKKRFDDALNMLDKMQAELDDMED